MNNPFKTLAKQIWILLPVATVVGSGAWAQCPVENKAIPRVNTLLDSDWRFKSGDVADAHEFAFEASDWQAITIPHCWGWEQAQRGDTNYYRGPGWYRRNLYIGIPKAGRRFFLRFEAASSVADVYLNGQFLGEHRGAFGAFAYEITTNLSSNGSNILAVRVSNAPEPDVAPLRGDFNIYGGLYRPVYLIETAEENFAITDHASPGVTWLQTDVNSTQAVLAVTAQISNGSKQWRTMTFVTKVLAADGREVAVTNESIQLAPKTIAPYWSRLTVPNPHLWNGRRDPYLYQAVVELCSATGAVDAVEQPLGLRNYRVDPDKGFFLNGKPYPIYGVCRHQDRPDKGWGISNADMEQDIELIKEIGATAVRGAHYQQSSYFYSLCDQAGLLVWAEIPQVKAVNYTSQFEETSRNQLIDMIRQNINHPSVFVWSLFNEIGNLKTDDPESELQDLNMVAHSEDPTRPTIAASNSTNYPQMNKITDLLGWNNYPGWYKGRGDGLLESFGAVLDDEQFTTRSGGFCVSEYGAGANPTQHEENPRQPKPESPWHPEEWQMHVHEMDWATIKSRPFVWGSFIWNMFDFCVADRDEGSQVALNDKGLVTFDRKLKKDVFYFYKANWSDEPVLYVTGRRFTERTNAVTNVKIYSNAPEAELLVNGISQGKRYAVGNAVFLWPDVTLSPGENKIEAVAERNGQKLADSCVWKLSSR
jgi:beta-galactosidase